MAITAAMVKELRERTGAGMMECKKALVESNGDIDGAAELMRKTGLAKADKKAGRTAAEGVIQMALSEDGNTAVILEINSETDFVAKGDDFIDFVTQVADRALRDDVTDLDSLLEAQSDSGTINDQRQALVVKIGENIQIRRLMKYSSQNRFGAYLHGTRIGVLVEMQGGNELLVKDIAMHIAASRPVCVSGDEISADLLAKEKEIFTAQAAESGKPPEIVEKMVNGRIKKYIAEVTLLGQPFVKDPDTTVEKLLAGADAMVTRFVRFEVGEGIEKKTENFADEVMAQVKGA